ncbi:MAG: phytoene desaturase family protein [Cellulosilyticaceae bacterium]
MKKIIVIGAGISGLTAGIYALKSGFQVDIYEMQPKSGGVCIGWKKKDYYFDNDMKSLVGIKKGVDLNGLWHEVGALNNTTVYNPEYIFALEQQGKTLYMYKDLHKFKQHLTELAPNDFDKITRLCETIKRLQQLQIYTCKPQDLMGIKDVRGIMRTLEEKVNDIGMLGQITIEDYAENFESEIIKEALLAIYPKEAAAISVLFNLASLLSDNSGWPSGGATQMAFNMETTYRELGGNIYYKEPIQKIVIEKNKAVGVLLKNNKIETADYIITATNPYHVIYELVGQEYIHRKTKNYFENKINFISIPRVIVGLGVSCDLTHRPHQYYTHIKPIVCGDSIIDKIGIRHYCYENEFAPKGSSVINISIRGSSYGWWKNKMQYAEEYRYIIQKLSEDIIGAIEEIYPEIKGKIEVINITTPITYENNFNAYKGAVAGFYMTPKNRKLVHTGVIKEVRNLYMAGQWLQAMGGMSSAAITGKWAVQRICKKEKKEFISEY